MLFNFLLLEETQGLLSGDADVETEEERSVTNRIQLYAKLQTLAGYFFFIAIAAFVLVLIVVEQLAHAESSSMSMDDMTASHSHSVAYGVAFHYLFITAGYGIRAGQDASVLFLDVFRNAMYVVVPVTLVAFVACIATGASSSSVVNQVCFFLFFFLYQAILSDFCLGNIGDKPPAFCVPWFCSHCLVFQPSYPRKRVSDAGFAHVTKTIISRVVQ